MGGLWFIWFVQALRVCFCFDFTTLVVMFVCCRAGFVVLFDWLGYVVVIVVYLGIAVFSSDRF